MMDEAFYRGTWQEAGILGFYCCLFCIDGNKKRVYIDICKPRNHK